MTKHLSTAIKKGLVVGETTIFIANGAVAGQQSPHFLFHVIPDDGFDLEIPKGKVSAQEVQKVTPPLRANVAAIMKQYLQREGKLAKVVQKEQNDEQPVQQSIQHPMLPEREEDQPQAPEKEDVQERAQEYSRDNLAKVLMENPRLKEMIITEPEKVKEIIKTNKELAHLFEGINIDRLSKKLQEFEKKDKKDGEKGDSQKGASNTSKDNADEGKQDDADEPGHGDPELDKISRLFS
jgi:diadenosine tetraphosphate (Ap4A) HIT family hydrolase